MGVYGLKIGYFLVRLSKIVPKMVGVSGALGAVKGRIRVGAGSEQSRSRGGAGHLIFSV